MHDPVDVDPVLPRDREAALTTLFLAHHRSLVGFAYLLVDDLGIAEDIVQDAFLNLHRRWTRLRDAGAAYEYLRVAVLNGGRSHLRKSRVRASREAKVVPNAPSAETAAQENAEHAQMLGHLAGLPRRQRQVLIMRYYLDQSEAEIAATLSISSGSVKQHASRGLAALTARLEATS